MSAVLDVLITHQEPGCIGRMLEYWRSEVGSRDQLIVYGGEPVAFEAIPHEQRLLITDPRLKTRDHQREKQSYCPVFRAVSEWMTGRSYSHIYLAEYDHVPLVPDLHDRMLARLAEENADVLGHRVRRVDGSSNLHYLYHLSDPEFLPFWRRISVRSDPEVVLLMFGSGSFWTREAFDAVAQVQETTPIYLELFLPTAAHHLGFRVRSFGPEQDAYVRNLGELSGKIEKARAAGAWTIHPVKRKFAG